MHRYWHISVKQREKQREILLSSELHLLLKMHLFLTISFFTELSAWSSHPGCVIFWTYGRLLPLNSTIFGRILEFLLLKTMPFVFDFAGLAWVPNLRFCFLTNLSHKLTIAFSLLQLADKRNISSAKTWIPQLQYSPKIEHQFIQFQVLKCIRWIE